MLERLTKIVPPPTAPSYAGSDSTWRAVQEKLGVSLPDTLDLFGRIYGSGYFEGGEQVRLLNPHDPFYEGFVRAYSSIYVELREYTPQFYPYKYYPAPGGLFPLADVIDGMGIWLLPKSAPMDYLVIYDDRSTGLIEFPGLSICDFLCDFLANKLTPIPYFTDEIKFTSEGLGAFKGFIHGSDV